MELGLLTWAYPPEKSGLSRACREIAESLAASGHAVRVLTLDRTGRSMAGDVEVIGCALPDPGRLARLRRLVGIGQLVAPLHFATAFAAEHRRRRFDVIEATNWYAPALLLALVPRSLRGFRVVTRNSTPVASTARPCRTRRDRADLFVAVTAERLSARHSDGLISNTEAHGSKIAALYGVPPPGCGIGAPHAVIGLSLPAHIAAAGAASTYPDDRPLRLLFIGRAEPRKGFAELVEAIGLLADEAERGETTDFRATLVGVRDRDLGALGTAARARLVLHHRVVEDDLLALLGGTHVVLAPSRYESFGLVYQEALAFGRPILACAEDPSARRFVGESGAGRLAASCTGPAIASALRDLLNDADLRARLHRRAREAGGRFDRPTLARETVAAYRRAGASSGAVKS